MNLDNATKQFRECLFQYCAEQHTSNLSSDFGRRAVLLGEATNRDILFTDKIALDCLATDLSKYMVERLHDNDLGDGIVINEATWQRVVSHFINSDFLQDMFHHIAKQAIRHKKSTLKNSTQAVHKQFVECVSTVDVVFARESKKPFNIPANIKASMEQLYRSKNNSIQLAIESALKH